MKFTLSRLPIGLVILFLACSETVTGPKPGSVPLGAWGNSESGLGASRLTVTGAGGTLHQTCADGTISQPIVLDAGGRFDVAGEYAVTVGPTQNSQRARYTGSVSGQTMMLTVTETSSGATFGPFTLRSGEQPSLAPCPIV